MGGRSRFKTSPFPQFLRQTEILILKIHYVFLRLKFQSSLNLNKIEGIETASTFYFTRIILKSITFVFVGPVIKRSPVCLKK